MSSISGPRSTHTDHEAIKMPSGSSSAFLTKTLRENNEARFEMLDRHTEWILEELVGGGTDLTTHLFQIPGRIDRKLKNIECPRCDFYIH